MVSGEGEGEGEGEGGALTAVRAAKNTSTAALTAGLRSRGM